MSLSDGVYVPSGPAQRAPALDRSTQLKREHERLKLLSLFTTGHYSDLRLNCNKRSFEVHRNILCPQIPYLEKEIGSSKCAMGIHTQLNFAESDNVEAVEVILRFIYIGEMELPKTCSKPEEALKLLRDVHRLATTYEIRSALDVFTEQASKAYLEASARSMTDVIKMAREALTLTERGRPTGIQGLRPPRGEAVVQRCLEMLKDDSELS